MYRREIIYIGLYKNDDRVGGAGFLKTESGERESRLYLKTQNIPPGVSGKFPVRIYNGKDWKELSSVTVQDGGGCWEEKLPEVIEGAVVQIRLSGGYILEGKSRTAPETVKDRQEAVKEAPETAEKEPKAAEKGPEAVVVTEELPRRPLLAAVAVQSGQPDFSLKEDKWEQLRATFEQIHPYGDERCYVKLEPKDFVILQEKYQHLVNNSFLLHGFYNYRYVILGKEQDCYYLGVPGVYYEREKMVAQMFGFEAFECPGGEVKTGEFGYYLRRVEL